MLALIGGLVVNFLSINNPELFQFAVILLGAGFFLSIISSNLVNNWVREPRADQALATTLEKFGNNFILFNYTSVAPHILLTPSRLYVVIVRRQPGEIKVRGHRFSRKFSFIRVLRFFADESLGLPASEAQSKMDKLQKLLAAEMDEASLPEISALVVFTNKDVQLTVDNPALPVLTASELKLYLRENDKAKLIPATTRNEVIQILGQDYQETKYKKSKKGA